MSKIKYTPEQRLKYAKKAISLSAQGYSFPSISETLGIKYNTITKWVSEYNCGKMARFVSVNESDPELKIEPRIGGAMLSVEQIKKLPLSTVKKLFPLYTGRGKYTAEERKQALARYTYLRDAGIKHTSASYVAGVDQTTVRLWEKKGLVNADITPVLSRVGAQLEITPDFVAETDYTAPTAPIQSATTQHVAALTERVQSLEHDAQDAHQALYDVRERLSALEASDTEPTPFHAVDRTYVLVIAIMVVTVAITLVTVLL